MRFLSVLLSLPMVALAFSIGRRLMSVKAGIFAAWLMALSPLQVYYAQELRMYGLVAMLGMASMLLFIRLLQSQRGSLITWAAYALTTLLAVHTHYQAFMLVAIQALIVIISQRKASRRLMAWLGAGLGLGIAHTLGPVPGTLSPQPFEWHRL